MNLVHVHILNSTVYEQNIGAYKTVQIMIILKVHIVTLQSMIRV